MKFAVVLVAALVGAVHSESSEVPSPCAYDECAAGVFSPIEVLMVSFAENAERIKSATDGVACALGKKLKASKLSDDSKEEVYDCIETLMDQCANISSVCARNYADALAAIGDIIDQFDQTQKCERTTRFFSKNFIFNGCSRPPAGRCVYTPRFPGSAGSDSGADISFGGSANGGFVDGGADTGSDSGADRGFGGSDDDGADRGSGSSGREGMGFGVDISDVRISLIGAVQMSGEKETSEEKDSKSHRMGIFGRPRMRGRASGEGGARFRRMRRDTYSPHGSNRAPVPSITCDENCPYDENLRSDVRSELCSSMQDNFQYFNYPPSTMCPSKPDNCDKLCDDYKLQLSRAIHEQDIYVGYVIDCLNHLRDTIKGMEGASDDDLMGLCTSTSSGASSQEP